MTQTKSDVLQVRKDGFICTLTLNRPEKRNSLSPELLINLKETLDEFAKDDSVRAVVIRGAGDKSFCAGYDLNLLPTSDNKEGNTPGNINPFEEAMETIVNFPYPVIALMNGYAFGGGCDLAISCDIRIGVDNLRIGMVPAKLGVVYSASGLKRFINAVGIARTKELFFTGRHYQAPFLKEIGFLNYMLPQDEIESFTYAMAQEISENSPLSLKGTKKVLRLINDSNVISENDLKEAEAISLRSFLSEDLKEGQLAFFEKRKAEFKGK
ncbi:enoyl-CoA hydratase/isomerase family protein [bacterium]|nr:enoyl-CoA hydratase/isomerase family protein [bacterium]